MIIRLNNFGMIKTFSYDTKDDFTLVFGKNNTGKSYAISAIYLIIKNILSLEEHLLFRYFLPETSIEQKFASFEKKLESKESIDIKKDIEEIVKEIYEKTFIKSLQESFKSTFDSIENMQNKLNEEHFQIVLESDLITIQIIIKDKALYLSSLIIKKEKIELKKSQRNLTTKDEHDIIKIYTSNSKEGFSEKILNVIVETTQYINSDVRESINGIYYLPASRSGLYQALSAFGQIIAELSKSRKFTTKKIELPSISEPLSDYFLELSNIKLRKNSIENTITQVASDIESTILNGKIEFDKNTKKLMFLPNGTKLKLDLSYTSSMVSEMSPIVSYLRYVINYADDNILSFPFGRKRKFESAKPLIIIEEPEAHLHPSIQIELLGQFAKLSKKDVKFIITTHSNYMFNKFNNLVLSKDIDVAYSSSMLFKESSTGSEAFNMDIDEFGVDDENFVSTSEELYNEKLKLIEKLNKNESDAV